MPHNDPNVPGDDGNPALRLLRLVESFEDGWVAGSPTALEDWLAAAAAGADDRDELLRHGLAVEVAHRRRRGESPTPGDYLDRFPDRRSLIDEALAEPRPRPDADPSGESWPHPGGTVLETLDRSAGPMPRVLLGDTPGDAEAPVVRPSSSELPAPSARPARVQLLGEIARGGDGGRAQGVRSRPRPRPGRQGPARGAPPSARPDPPIRRGGADRRPAPAPRHRPGV